MSDRKPVVVSLTWTEARALAYAASIGLSQPKRWPSHTPGYSGIAEGAREKLLVASAEAEGRPYEPENGE